MLPVTTMMAKNMKYRSQKFARAMSSLASALSASACAAQALSLVRDESGDAVKSAHTLTTTTTYVTGDRRFTSMSSRGLTGCASASAASDRAKRGRESAASAC